jgi:hypothetical protein
MFNTPMMKPAAPVITRRSSAASPVVCTDSTSARSVNRVSPYPISSPLTISTSAAARAARSGDQFNMKSATIRTTNGNRK